MTYTHCQNCGSKLLDPALTNTCPGCGRTSGHGHGSTITISNIPGLNWHRDTPTGWTPERVKACYDYCDGVGTELLTPGGLERLREAYADLQVKYDVLVKRKDGGVR